MDCAGDTDTQRYNFKKMMIGEEDDNKGQVGLCQVIIDEVDDGEDINSDVDQRIRKNVSFSEDSSESHN